MLQGDTSSLKLLWEEYGQKNGDTVHWSRDLKLTKAHFLYNYKVPLNTITETFTNLGLSGIYYKVIPLPASTQHATTYLDNKTKTMNKH